MSTTAPRSDTSTLARVAHAREEEFLTVAEIATRLRVARMTVYRMVEAGDFPGTIRVGGRNIRIPAASVDAYLKTSRVAP